MNFFVAHLAGLHINLFRKWLDAMSQDDQGNLVELAARIWELNDIKTTWEKSMLLAITVIHNNMVAPVPVQ